jgi:DASS family divalent anion:Na+ symporter
MNLKRITVLSPSFALTSIVALSSALAKIAQAFPDVSISSVQMLTTLPSLIAIVLLPLIVAKLFPPRVGKTPEAPTAARKELADMGGMSRDEWITAGTFVLMVAGWIFG